VRRPRAWKGSELEFKQQPASRPDVIVNVAGGGNIALQTQVAWVLTLGRQLDRTNLHTTCLRNDFGRLGLTLIDKLEEAHGQSARRLDVLDNVVELRNGIAHADEPKLARLSTAGYKATKPAFRGYRRAFDGLAQTMDRLVADHLAVLLSVQRPW
jgi:hypothetical protein